MPQEAKKRQVPQALMAGTIGSALGASGDDAVEPIVGFVEVECLLINGVRREVLTEGEPTGLLGSLQMEASAGWPKAGWRRPVVEWR